MSTAAMELLQWGPQYVIDNGAIDREHQRMFGLVNCLHEAMLAGKGASLLSALLTEATRYTFDHFAREEALMSDVRYPGLQLHVAQHSELRHKVNALRQRYANGEVTMTIELTFFLSEWIKIHIMTEDRRIGQYINANRRARTAALAPFG